SPDDPNAVLDGPLILGSIRSGKIGIGLQLLPDLLVTDPDGSYRVDTFLWSCRPSKAALQWFSPLQRVVMPGWRLLSSACLPPRRAMAQVSLFRSRSLYGFCCSSVLP